MSLSLRFLPRLIGKSVPIIGVLLVALAIGGCSAVRLGYNTSPALVYWWLDSYFDFDSEQSIRIRNDMQATQDWHRKDELPLLAQKLKELQAMAPKPVTADQVCRIVEALQTRVQVTLERVTPSIAAIAPTLQPAQLENMAKEFERRDRKWREEWLDGTVAERAERRLKQIVERAESFYGTLEPNQLTALRGYIASSSFDGPRQFREMQRRHEDALLILRKIRSGDSNAAQAQAEIKTLLQRTLRAPAPAYRRYIEQLTDESCAAMEALHNSSTPKQRAQLLDTLKGYESDARALISQRTDDIPGLQTPTPF